MISNEDVKQALNRKKQLRLYLLMPKGSLLYYLKELLAKMLNMLIGMVKSAKARAFCFLILRIKEFNS